MMILKRNNNKPYRLLTSIELVLREAVCSKFILISCKDVSVSATSSDPSAQPPYELTALHCNKCL